MDIRSANKNDLESCANLLKQPGLEIPSGGYFKENWLFSYLDENFFLVAENNNEIIGVIVAEKIKLSGCILWWLAVSPIFHGKGVGSKLLLKLESNCKKIGIDWIILYSPIQNKKSIVFYEQRGFKKGKKQFEMLKNL